MISNAIDPLTCLDAAGNAIAPLSCLGTAGSYRPTFKYVVLGINTLNWVLGNPCFQ